MPTMLEAVLALAARSTGSAAERDHELVTGGGGSLAIMNAIYDVAAQRLGVPPGQRPSDYGITLEQQKAEADAVRAAIADGLQAHVAGARTHRYVGWSNASGGPVRYAD